jgi:NADPH:quinone reductase
MTLLASERLPSGTVRRWIAPTYGDPGVLREVEVDLPAPRSGEVQLEIRASGVNPIDFKNIEAGEERALPILPGFEVAGVIRAIGPSTVLRPGVGGIGAEVIAYRIAGGYATAVTVPSDCVFEKPPGLEFPEAANLLLAGTTAAEMLQVTGVRPGETVLVHGASGAVGVSILQQTRALGARAIGTSSERNFGVVREFGGEPVAYGPGLEGRVRAIAPGGVAAALDAVGTNEAVDVSLALVADRERIVTIVAFDRARSEGFRAIINSLPQSAAFRTAARARLVEMAARGQLRAPVARVFPLDDAVAALRLLQTGHAGGKLALVPTPPSSPTA